MSRVVNGVCGKVACDRWFVTQLCLANLCLQDGVAKVVGGTVCVCRCCVSVWNMLCDTDGVWQSFMWWGVMGLCVKDGLSNLHVTKLCEKDVEKSVWQMMCVWQMLCGKNSVWQGFHVTKLCVMDGLCFKLQVTKPCVKDGRWQSSVWVMAPDNLVCARLCVTKFLPSKDVTKLCVTGGVWKKCVWKTVCDRVVCERRCVIRLCVIQVCVKGGVWQRLWWQRVVCAEVGSETYCVAQ